MATFVLVHGSYQGGWIWQRVADRLDGRAHRPTTWLLGVNVGDLLRSVSGRRPAANEALKKALIGAGAAVALDPPKVAVTRPWTSVISFGRRSSMPYLTIV